MKKVVVFLLLTCFLCSILCSCAQSYNVMSYKYFALNWNGYTLYEIKYDEEKGGMYSTTNNVPKKFVSCKLYVDELYVKIKAKYYVVKDEYKTGNTIKDMALLDKIEKCEKIKIEEVYDREISWFKITK